jgi:hypothetical protein
MIMAASLKSITLKNKLLGGSGGNKLQTLMNLSHIIIFGGTPPTTADGVETGTRLCVVTNNSTGTGLTFDDPVAGILAKAAAEVWSGVNLATGDATHFRLVEAAYTDGASSATQMIAQGTVAAGGDVVMVLSAIHFTSGATFVLPTYEISIL